MRNAKDFPITQVTGSLPNVGVALSGWFQPMVFTTIVKTVVNFKLIETPTSVSFLGVWQPFTAQQLALKSVGERAWRWFSCHADPSLKLSPDDCVTYQAVQYRVKEKNDFSLYGFIDYQLIEDFTGSGP